MTIHGRLKMIVKYLIGQGIAENQEKIGELLGYNNKASFSHILNNRKPLPSDFTKRISALDEKVNKVWIETGEGYMLKPISQNSGNMLVGDYNNNVQLGHNMNSSIVSEPNAGYGLSSLEIELATLKKEIKLLKTLLEEKERLIQILLNK